MNFNKINNEMDRNLKQEEQNKPDNSGAFHLSIPGYCVIEPEYGMTLLDYFAAKAMQAFITSPQYYDVVKDNESASNASYIMANAMLKERKKHLK